MKAHELANLLLSFPNIDVMIFAEGFLYPALQVQEFEGVVEIGCGWDEIITEE